MNGNIFSGKLQPADRFASTCRPDTSQQVFMFTSCGGPIYSSKLKVWTARR